MILKLFWKMKEDKFVFKSIWDVLSEDALSAKQIESEIERIKNESICE